jgi:nitrate reductase beta subunit
LEIVLILTLDRCMVCAECSIGLEIILDEANGNPR